ncbi:sphingosine kinase [Actinoplanes sp. TRM 88003]|uniref:Sphingosine kinase n=1 Tax=Paractinoplanes aksuensis TaxID=2939490 RepID=A0ABT1DH07_9ACTN|nr:diacylglycerol kinase family protein [Actinoplanes aksuensis]MCO8270121.1 sphingosine kinase [Actinoplanes aksuensis]
MTSFEIAVLANPTAGRGRHRDLLSEVLRKLGDSGRTVRLLTAHSSSEAEAACRAAVDGGAAAVVAVGGDGTIHRALQAVAERPVGFGVVPAGTGNDFAAAVGMSADPVVAAGLIASALTEGRHVPIDLARVASAGLARADEPDHRADDPGRITPAGAAAAEEAGHRGADTDVRWFGAVLAGGFDALVNERANLMRWPRGPRRYDLAILLELARLKPRKYALELDGEDYSFEGMLVAVGNCASYGGGMRILPDADPTDGLLDVVIAAPFGRAALARLKPRLRRGTHVSDPRVTVFRARHVRLRSDGIVAYADGERLGPLDLDLTCSPGAVRLLR